ncbi:hypothetical protein FRC17_002019 [Serendipita sp. 399]|nr:hypothetical protein FRC17_002019 [Serendipita sp. 399]
MATTQQTRRFGVISDTNGIANQTFDYVVVGGGLTGITVAARLAENPSNTILIIEAGRNDRDNPLVYDIFQYGNVFASDLNWRYPTEEGKNITAGKTLGGGSSINGTTWTRGQAAQYNAWGSLLTPAEAHLGWNWNNLFEYMKKASCFLSPSIRLLS